MIVEFQDVVALDILFEDVLLDEVSFEDSTTFTVEFDDFSLHPSKHYFQSSIVPMIVGTDHLTGINSESTTVVADIHIKESLTRLADLPSASVVAVASASGELLRLKFAEPVEAAIDIAAEESLTRILDGQRRRIRIKVAGGGKLSLKGPLQSSAIVHTHVSGVLNAVTPLEPAESTALISITEALTRIIALESAASVIPVSITGEIVCVKFMEPATSIPFIDMDATMVRTHFMTSQTAIAGVTATSHMKVYQAIKGDDDYNLAGDDELQLGDTF